jgi:AraC-like DNA-binding protein
MLESSDAAGLIRSPFAPARRAAWNPVAASATQARCAAAAVAAIDAAIGRPLRMPAIAFELGVSSRTLYQAIVAVTGFSPYQYVRQRRLVIAHERLQEGGATELVKCVAIDLGFTHFGRFAACYRALFGEAPSATLQYARHSRGTRRK